MLTSLLGIRLLLLIGDTVPLPASYEVTSALTQVEVTNDAENGDGFQMTFTIGKEKTGDFSLVKGSLDLFKRVIIGVLFGATPEVLIDGIITHQQIAPQNDPGTSTITVTGKDVSVMLDLEEKNAKFENQPDFVIVTQLLANYAQYGLVPMPTPTTDIPIMLERIPRQHETDLQFIKRMAERNGFIFYVEPITFFANKAYFGPETRASAPQPALTQNLGASSNLNSISFSNDGLAPVESSGSMLEPITKTAIPFPSLPSLRLPPLVTSPTEAKRKTLLRNMANKTPGAAAVSSIAAASRTPDPVTGTGELDAVRYGTALRARRIVGVRGAGITHDGFYYVRSVTHRIQRGEYTQSFQISREGTGPLLPVVLP